MSGSNFEVLVNTSGEILAHPPPKFAHLGVTYAPFAVRAGAAVYPSPAWCDFAGVWLFRWYEAVWKLAERDSRAARLPFLHTYEVWLRRTPKPWWKASLVERYKDKSVIGHEVLVVPERVEAALLTAIRRLLAGARGAGVWPEDCAALENLIDDPRGYLGALDSGSVPVPRFLTAGFKVPLGR